MVTGNIFDIKRFAVHDGPGIRTTLFLKGCPLHCPWCHNPESRSAQPELSYIARKCIRCGQCVKACPAHAHSIGPDTGHVFDRGRCRACGLCEKNCLGNALRLYGRRVTVEEVLPELLEDRDFYETSGGGVTVSGGEPLLQAAFVAELLAKTRESGVSTALDTCGAVPWNAFEAVLPYTDLLLYDLKHIDSAAHERATGLPNTLILQNLQRLSERRVPVEIRIPVIPGFNDDDSTLEAMAELLANQHGLTAVRLLKYHDFARSKFEAVGQPDTMPHVTPPSDMDMERCAQHFRACDLRTIL